MKYIKLEIAQNLDTDDTISKTIPVESEDANLLDCIEAVVGENRHISFQRYYDNIILMSFGRMFPYIISDETIQWRVPFSDVTIADFRRTHNLAPDDVIHAETYNYGGDGYEASELISWIVRNWDAINNVLGPVSSLITISGFIHKVYKYFANKWNRLPDFGDVEEVVEKQHIWDSNRLMKLLKVDDAELMDCLSYSIGYKRFKNTYIKEPIEDKIGRALDSANLIWGVQTCSRWSGDITRGIHNLNLMLTDLKFRAENLELEFSNTEDAVNKLIDKWDTYLAHGESLSFVKLIIPPKIYDRYDLEKDINNLESNIQKILDRISEIEARSEDCSQNEQGTINSEIIETLEYEENGETDYEEADNEMDYYVSPWEILLTRLLVNNQLTEIITNYGSMIAYINQIYDNDVLLQLLSKDGRLIGYKTCNYYDIKTITTDTSELRLLQDNVPRCMLPSIPTYGTSAKDYSIDYAIEENLPVILCINDTSSSLIKGKVIELEETVGLLEEPLIKVQMLNEDNENCGNAWLEYSSVEWVSMPILWEK